MTTAAAVTPEVIVAPVPGSPEHDAAMAAAGSAAVELGNTHKTAVEPAAIPPKPEGVPDKFYDAKTGVVNYAAMTTEYNYILSQKGKTETPEAKAQREAAEKVTADAATAKAKAETDAKAAVEAAKAKLAAATTDADKATAQTELTAAEAKVTASTTQSDAEKTAAAVTANAGLDLATLNKEYAETGKLAEASYEALAKSGIDRATVDQFIAGQQAIAAQTHAAAYAIVGGEENYKTETAWAKASLSAAEIAAYNQAVSTGTKEQIELAVNGLHAKYEKANGKLPAGLVSGGTGGTGTAQPFRSQVEQTAAMQDPRYAKDPAYRDEVIARIAVTNL